MIFSVFWRFWPNWPKTAKNAKKGDFGHFWRFWKMRKNPWRGKIPPFFRRFLALFWGTPPLTRPKFSAFLSLRSTKVWSLREGNGATGAHDTVLGVVSLVGVGFPIWKFSNTVVPIGDSQGSDASALRAILSGPDGGTHLSVAPWRIPWLKSAPGRMTTLNLPWRP